MIKHKIWPDNWENRDGEPSALLNPRKERIKFSRTSKNKPFRLKVGTLKSRKKIELTGVYRENRKRICEKVCEKEKKSDGVVPKQGTRS